VISVETFRKTRAAAGYAARHAGAEVARVRAAAILEHLAALEMAAADGNHLQAAAGTRLLRSLLAAVRDLAGTEWLEVMADDPDVTAFTAIPASGRVPKPERIDEICSRVLWARFSPDGIHRKGTG
jgi:hypothetical protein